MTSDETQIQILANWPMSHEKRVTKGSRKNPEYRVVAAIRKLRTDKNCPAGTVDCYGVILRFAIDFRQAVKFQVKWPQAELLSLALYLSVGFSSPLSAIETYYRFQYSHRNQLGWKKAESRTE